MAGCVACIRRALVLGLVLIAGTAIEHAPFGSTLAPKINNNSCNPLDHVVHSNVQSMIIHYYDEYDVTLVTHSLNIIVAPAGIIFQHC